MEIFASGDFNEEQVARLHEIAGSDSIHIHGQFDKNVPVEASFARCEIAFGNLPASWLAGDTALRWMQLESVGFGEYADLDWCKLGTRITLTNLADFFTEPVAESALAGILALYRGIDCLARLQAASDWQSEAVRTRLRTLEGTKVVLFGYGAINRRLSELLQPFRCAIDSFGSDWQAGELDRALSTSDIVVSVAPDTPATREVFNRERLALLRDSVVFVNFGRGSVADEEALVDALSTGRLGGAVIDVTLDEPLPDYHPLWICPNTIITQHSGGGTMDEIDRKLDVFAANLVRYRNGEQLVGTVNFSKGY